jgi:hypothetical protein
MLTRRDIFAAREVLAPNPFREQVGKRRNDLSAARVTTQLPALLIADAFAVQQGLSSLRTSAYKTLAALSSEPVEWLHVDWMKAVERLLQFFRGGASVHHETRQRLHLPYKGFQRLRSTLLRS